MATWRLDVKGADVRAGLSDAGVPALLLKGGAFRALLYCDGSARAYGDCDLLVQPSLGDTASIVLTDLGFVPTDRAPHARAWYRESDGMWVDLHHSLPHLEADPERVWSTLWRRAASITVGGSPTWVLDPGATALLTALHLVHHGRHASTPSEDLARAVEHLGDDCWREAAALAATLDASAALGTGLRLLPAGVEIADRLGLPWRPTPYALLRWGAPWEATVWESIAGAAHLRTRASLVAKFLAPRPDFLRERSALARRGPCGLALAYAVRPFPLAARAARSFGPWRRARRVPR